jgi:hypothetical protein
VASRLVQTIGNGLRLFFRLLRETRTGRAIVFMSLPLALVAVAFSGPDRLPPIFDVQLHYNEDAWEGYSSHGIVRSLQRLNVRWAAVSSTPNEGTHRLFRLDARRVVPLLVPYRSRDDREHWIEDPATIEWLARELDQGSYRGIGELHLYEGRVDTPVLRRLVALAVRHDLVLSVHAQPNVIEQLFGLDRRMRVLWAHAGFRASPRTVGYMLEMYPNLWAELSHRVDIAPDGELVPEWRALFERFPHRFMIGSGTYTNEFWHRYGLTLEHNRAWLRQLPPALAERVAYRNALDLFFSSEQPVL